MENDKLFVVGKEYNLDLGSGASPSSSKYLGVGYRGKIPFHLFTEKAGDNDIVISIQRNVIAKKRNSNLVEVRSFTRNHSFDNYISEKVVEPSYRKGGVIIISSY